MGKEPNTQNKIRLLQAKQFLSEQYNLDVPMVFMDKRKVTTWTPDLQEVAILLNSMKSKIINIAANSPEKTHQELLHNLAAGAGFSLKTKEFTQEISSRDIGVLNKKEFLKEEIISCIHDITALPKGGRFSYGIEGRLMEAVNNRLEKDGLTKVNTLDNVILQRQDIKNFVNMLDKEIGLKNKNHKHMSGKELDNFTNIFAEEIKRPKAIQSSTLKLNELTQLLSKHKSGNFIKIKEFFNKVKSLFQENIIIKKIAPVNKNHSPGR